MKVPVKCCGRAEVVGEARLGAVVRPPLRGGRSEAASVRRGRRWDGGDVVMTRKRARNRSAEDVFMEKVLPEIRVVEGTRTLDHC